MAYDFNYDLYTLTPDAFRARWAPSLKDFNDEEILRMRAMTPAPRRLIYSEALSETTDLDYSPPANTVVTHTEFALAAFNDLTRHVLFAASDGIGAVPISMYAGEYRLLVEGYYPTITISGLTGDEQLVVTLYGYRLAA